MLGLIHEVMKELRGNLNDMMNDNIIEELQEFMAKSKMP